MKEPQKLPLEAIWEAYQASMDGLQRVFFSKAGFIQVMGSDTRLFRLVMQTGTPYLIEEYRCGLVLKGWVRGWFNLRECQIGAGTLAFIAPGSLVEFHDMSDDFQLVGMGIPHELFRMVHGGQVPPLFNGQLRDGQVVISEPEQMLVSELFHTLWVTGHSPASGQETMHRLVAAITWQFNELFARKSQALTDKPGAVRPIFERFITLVNEHSRTQRRLDFYADKLCITERYLGTVVRQASGVTAKEWVDRSVMSHAKVMLRHSPQQVAQIADELHFPNPSFFCKYFKRLAGCTPEEYRRQAGR